MLSALDLEKVKNATESISAYDENLNITLWNPAVGKRHGVTEENALGQSLFSLFPYAAGDQRINFLRIAMVTGQSFYFPNMIYLYTQPFTYYSQYIQPIRKNGRIIGVVNIVRDHLMEESFSAEEFREFFGKE